MTTHDGRSRSRQVERIGAATLVALVLCLGGAVAGAQGRDIEPVTDAMLQNPDPADWLNWRRTLDGWGYSPLDQIDRENVDRLQLVWGWQLGVHPRVPRREVRDRKLKQLVIPPVQVALPDLARPEDDIHSLAAATSQSAPSL